LKHRLYRPQRPRINRPLTCFVIYSTEVVVIVGLFAIGIMVHRAQTAHLIGTFWLIKLSIGMPSQRSGTTIDRAPISLDSARRLILNLLIQLASGTPAMPDVAASKVSTKRRATRCFGPSLCSDCFLVVSQESNRIGRSGCQNHAYCNPRLFATYVFFRGNPTCRTSA